MKSLFIFTALLFISLIYSCKKDKSSVDFHENYFPLTNGTFVTYDVTEINHNGGASIDTIQYVLKTRIGDTVLDNEGRIARKFYRFKLNKNTNLFETSDLWTSIINDKRAELVEENQRIIKLVFAPTLSKEWDINAFNANKPLLAIYENIHKSASINGFNFDSTITVVQERTEILLTEYRLKTEIYAVNVGLISKYYKDLKIDSFDTLKIKTGIEIYYKLRNYGVE